MMITLLTDFGLADHFVGTLKGVIASISPKTPVVDITHEVPAYSIPQAAFLLDQSWRYFPKGTIHVAIVDPGVGSSRRPLLIESEQHYCIGPDNGLFSFILADPKSKVRHLNKPKYWLPDISTTFHGRDIFAPVAAHLANKIKPSQLGTLITDPIRTPALLPTRLSRRTWVGTVLHIDRYGNLITNYSQQQFDTLRNRPFSLTAGLHQTELYASTYAHCPEGELCVIPGSSGYWELSLANASAAKLTGLTPGSPLELTLA
ncbi:MAG: SAM-dependent chlorinase/fluorinase [Acidobacteria bacterium]|nr:SAM-dependent chlorinase/fluorinase [Acidobacteriota bacterium]